MNGKKERISLPNFVGGVISRVKKLAKKSKRRGKPKPQGQAKSRSRTRANR